VLENVSIIMLMCYSIFTRWICYKVSFDNIQVILITSFSLIFLQFA